MKTILYMVMSMTGKTTSNEEDIFEKSEWRKVRTNNILEREFRELRRRINVMDSSFNDRDSASRYAAATFSYLNQNYPATRRTLHTNA